MQRLPTAYRRSTLVLLLGIFVLSSQCVAQDNENWGRTHFKQFPGIAEVVPFPDPELTPGQLSDHRTIEQICAADFSTKQVRCAKPAMKNDVAIAYGIDILKPPCSGACEGDHWFSLEDLGIDPCEISVPPSLLRSRDQSDQRKAGELLSRSFWFQPGFKKPYTYKLPDGKTGHFGAHRKDAVEGLVHRALCAHELSLDKVPMAFANWPLIAVANDAQKTVHWANNIDWSKFTDRDLGEYVQFTGQTWNKVAGH